MKRFISIAYIFFALWGFSGCADFLEEKNKGKVSLDSGFYETKEGMESITNSCYTSLRYWGGKTFGISMGDSGTDIVADASCDYPAIANYTNALAGTDPVCERVFTLFYAAINYCNTAIERIPKADADETLRHQREGEVRFLRAFYYWILVETYGDMYYSGTPTYSITTRPQKTTVADIYEKIFQDLDFALKCPLSEEQSDGGRVTMWAVKAFKARLLLTRASTLNDASYYQQAYELAKEVIDNGPFKLNKNYAAVFDMANSDGNGNEEVIWYVDYSSTNQLYNRETEDYTIRSGGNHGHLAFCMKYDDQAGMKRSIEYGRPFTWFMPSRFLLDLYDTENDQRFAATFRSVWKQNGGNKGKYPLMQDGDTAIYAIHTKATDKQLARAKDRYRLLDRDSIYNADGSVRNHKQFMQIKKFEDPTRATIAEDRSSRDAFLVRLAEMYFIAAEAGAKTGESEALSYMNTFRKTRAVAGKENLMVVTQSDIENIDFILDERGRELVGEHIRWFDLKRCGVSKFMERIKKGNPDAGKNVAEHHIVRPFPQDFLDAIENKDEFLQNPVYK